MFPGKNCCSKPYKFHLADNITTENTKNNWTVHKNLNIYFKPKIVVSASQRDEEKILYKGIRLKKQIQILQNKKDKISYFNFELISINDIISLKSEAIGTKGIGLQMSCKSSNNFAPNKQLHRHTDVS